MQPDNFCVNSERFVIFLTFLVLNSIPIEDRFKFIIIETLKQYIYVFQNKRVKIGNQSFGNFTHISEAFQRCYLDDEKTGSFFSRVINNPQSDYSRYIYFYLTYLIQKKKIRRS